MNTETKQFMKKLKENKKILSKQQYSTIKGQVRAGDIEGARKGLNKLVERSHKEWLEQSPRCSLCRRPSSYHM